MLRVAVFIKLIIAETIVFLGALRAKTASRIARLQATRAASSPKRSRGQIRPLRVLLRFSWAEKQPDPMIRRAFVTL